MDPGLPTKARFSFIRRLVREMNEFRARIIENEENVATIFLQAETGELDAGDR